ncbi:hypothetical protein CEXT_700881 [Caerostris extrusa]|uniref:Uncharacterized protein n=1 Tax=Caerostris extrusa TaxID=172846 RepID=A0AAV4WXM5_CAEEX|nr:hypothetical protein CEXT_700881 [Caerostris extrusa]
MLKIDGAASADVVDDAIAETIRRDMLAVDTFFCRSEIGEYHSEVHHLNSYDSDTDIEAPPMAIPNPVNYSLL